MAASPFLTAEELLLIEQPRRYQPRETVKISPDQYAVNPTPEEIGSSVTQILRSFGSKEGTTFKCHCIAVRPDDGMSWSAEWVRQRVLSSCPQFSVATLGNRSDPELPEIVALCGERRLLRVAVKHHLARWYPTLSFPRLSLLVAIAGILGVLVSVGNALLKIVTPTSMTLAKQLSSLQFFLPAVTVTLLGVGFKFVSDYLAPRQKAASIDQFRQRLKEDETREGKPSQRYLSFIEDVAHELKWSERPRVVIIDNYERLDPTSRAIIEQYLRVQRKMANISEFWLVMELPDGEALSHAIEVNRERYERKKFDFFKQLPLSQKAIENLSQIMELDEFPPGSAVKRICRGGTVDYANRTMRMLEEHRQNHPINPQQYGDFEFFYLLSIASIPAEETFSKNELLAGLAGENQRNQILKLLLPNTHSSRAEFSRHLEAVEHEFTQFVETAENGKLTFLHDPAIDLEEHYATFELPNPGLAHLYWALYRWDKTRNLVPQAFLLRKLQCHLLKATLDGVPEELLGMVVNQLFEAVLYVIDSSLRTCLFDNLPKLADLTADLSSRQNQLVRERSRERLLSRCWDIFAVLANANILGTILQLNDAPAAEEAVDTTQCQPLTELFLEAIPLDDYLRPLMRRAFSVWARQGYGNGVAAQCCADAYAGWVLASMASLVPPPPGIGGTIQRAYTDANKLILCFELTCKRLTDGKSEMPMLTDVLTLSHCLWSIALLLAKDASADGSGLLMHLAEKALIVATELKGRTSGPHTEAVANALSRELAAVAMASLLTVHRHVTPEMKEQLSWEVNIRRSLSDGLTMFGQTEPTPGAILDLNAADLVREVSSLLSTCAYMWMRFGLDSLRDLAYLRRMQFNFICLEIAPDDHHRIQPLLEPVAPALAGRGAISVLAHCSVASCLRQANDLAIRFLYRAACIAFDGQFGAGFQADLAVMVVYHGHALQLDLDAALQILLREEGEGMTTLRRVFRRLSSDQVSGYALRFLNASARTREDSTKNEVEEAIEESAGFLPDGSEAETIHSLLRLHKLRRKAQRGDPLPPESEVLAEWSGQQNSWMFAAVILTLIDKTDPTRDVWERAHSLLTHDPEFDETTSFLSLAITLLEHIDDGVSSADQKNQAVWYLRLSIKRWERLMSVETNLQAYSLLAENDSELSHLHSRAIIKWQKIKIERDHISRLPELVQQKKYFLIFSEYCDAARVWGLRNNGSREQWREFRRGDGSGRHRLFADWLESGAQVPQPLIMEASIVISAQFLWIGFQLFSPPVYNDDRYDEHRSGFNSVARENLRRLTDVILSLPEMPEEIRMLLTYHSKQLMNYSGILRGNGR